MTLARSLSVAASCALALLGLGLAHAPASAQSPRQIAGIPAINARAIIKERVVLSAETVTLGDLVENAGSAHRQTLFRAPSLGQYGTIQTWRILEAAKSYGLEDIDTRGLEEVRVERLSRSVSVNEMSDAIAAELADRMGSNDRSRLAVTIEGNITAAHVDYGSTAPLAIENLRHDAATGRFEATLIVPDSAHSRRAPVRVFGMAQEMVEIIRVSRSLNRGETIGPQDVQTDRVPRPRAGIESPLPASSIIGMVARRALPEGTSPRAVDLERPRMVSRNDSVTLVYEIPGLTVTARGKALENGTIGDVIDILNLQSKRTLQATVTGHGKVVVQSATPRRVATLAAPR